MRKNIHKQHSDWINWKLLKHKKMIRTIYGRINLEARRTKKFIFNSCREGCWYMRQGYMEEKVEARRGRNFKPFLILDDSNSFQFFQKVFKRFNPPKNQQVIFHKQVLCNLRITSFNLIFLIICILIIEFIIIFIIRVKSKNFYLCYDLILSRNSIITYMNTILE